MNMTPVTDDCSTCDNHHQGHFNRDPCKSCLDNVSHCVDECRPIFYVHWKPRVLRHGEFTETDKHGVPLDKAIIINFNSEYGIATDDINKPPHYHRGGIECIDYLKAKLTPEEFLGFLKGNCMKYLSRMGHKDSASKDAAKAAWYANRLQKEVE